MLQLEAVTPTSYNSAVSHGVFALVFAGLASFLAILILGVILLIKTFYDWRGRGGVLPQTHATAYFGSLLLANTFQALGSILNLRWIAEGEARYETTCVGQGIMKNLGDVGSALWSLIIAFHTFDVLFLRRKQSRVTLWATLIGTWTFIFFIDIIGPAILQKPEYGPFFGVTGYWCWITSNYPQARILLEYMFMFVSAFFCAVLHAAVFLRLRGNLSGENWRNIKFRRISRSERWVLKIARDEVDSRMYKVTTQLMWYPLVYTLVIIPIAVTRFVDFAGYDVPFWLTITADFFFILNGFINVFLFWATYRRIPVEYLPTLAAPRKSLHITNFGITPFLLKPADESDAKLDAEKFVPAEQDSESHRDSMASISSTIPLTRDKCGNTTSDN